MSKTRYYLVFLILFLFVANVSPLPFGNKSTSIDEATLDAKNESQLYNLKYENKSQDYISEENENNIFGIINAATANIKKKLYGLNISMIINSSLDENSNSSDIFLQSNDTENAFYGEDYYNNSIATNCSEKEEVTEESYYKEKSRNLILDFIVSLSNWVYSMLRYQPPRKNSYFKAINLINVSNKELAEISEILLGIDMNNAKNYVSLFTQTKLKNSTNEDLSPQPLFTINNTVWKIPTISLMKDLYDNYEQDVRVNEMVTTQEKLEEDKFLDEILSTPVMVRLMEFLTNKGAVSSNKFQLKQYFSKTWFGLYPRSRGRISSSGFEHIFLSEIKKHKISGLHNWLYFHTKETEQHANYFGYLKKIDLGAKGAILKFAFSLNGIYKPVSSMFIGTSPELEMALYSLCFFTRANKKCPIYLNRQKINIRTHTYRHEGFDFIGSAFPEI